MPHDFKANPNTGVLLNDLRGLLVRYRTSPKPAQQKLMSAITQTINELPVEINNKEDAIKAYGLMSYAATLIKYANVLHSIQNSGYFDILFDFKIKDDLFSNEFQDLTQYFELHPKTPQMRIKCNIEEVPDAMWARLREAQKAKLKRDRKDHLFNLDQLPTKVADLPKDQLFPIPIQCLGDVNNRAVDMLWGTSNGVYTLVDKFGYLLPGGGMIEINNPNVFEYSTTKVLDENLEEQRANLWLTARHYYNEIEQEQFAEVLVDILADETIKAEYRLALEESINTNGYEVSNHWFLMQMVLTVDDLIANNQPDEKALRELRARVQVDTIKHSSLYKEAKSMLEKTANQELIEQFMDVRACGGKNTSHAYLMFGEKSLNEFLTEKLDGATEEYGDDITNAKKVELTLLQAITDFNKVKFSHLLIMYVHQVKALTNNVMEFKNVWNQEQYVAAKESLVAAVTATLNLIAPPALVPPPKPNKPDDSDSKAKTSATAGAGLFDTVSPAEQRKIAEQAATNRLLQQAENNPGNQQSCNSM